MAVALRVPRTLAEYTQAVLPETANAWASDNGAWIKDIIGKHNAWLIDEGIAELQAVYDGYLEEIENRDKDRGDGINNKLQVSYAQLVIDTIVDYMLGKAPVWTVEDPNQADIDEETGEAPEEPEIVTQYRMDITALLKKSQRVLAEMLRQGSIAGYSTVISWVDEKGQVDYEEYPVQEIIPVWDVRGRLVMVLRKYEIEIPSQDGQTLETRTRVEVYDDKYVTYYISDETGEVFELDTMELDDQGRGNPVVHLAGRIPVSIFVNATPATYAKRIKKNGTSDIGGGVLSLIKEYAQKMSDKSNLVEYLMDQYLLLQGCDTDENEVIKMRKARALLLKGDKNISNASFISQSQDDQAVENHLNRVRDTIYQLTFTPKLQDLQGATATEIKMKFAELDIKAGKKELYFVEAVVQLVQVLTDFLNAKRLTEAGVEAERISRILSGLENTTIELYSADWLTVTLNRNLPQNYQEVANIVKTLSGIVPDTYLLELLWFIDDPVKALAELKAQKAEALKNQIDAMGFGNEFTDTGGSNDTSGASE
jgi:SPP1 family phage portal protein